PSLFALLLLAPIADAGQQTTTSAASHAATLIRAGRLIDVESGRVLNGQQILVRDGKIEAVGPSVEAPSDATVLDLGKLTV
ncbi:hypothetical protein ACKI1X_48855, partial [Streptomyces turgidiscabies]